MVQFDDVQRRFKAAEDFLRERVLPLTPERLNAPQPGHWSIGQIVDHLLLSTDPLLAKAIQEAGGLATISPRSEASTTWLGRAICGAMAPGKRSVPAPKVFHPHAGPFDASVVERLIDQQRRLWAFAEGAKTRPVEKFKLASPASRLVKYTGADLLAIAASHTEYHLRQIEARLS